MKLLLICLVLVGVVASDHGDGKKVDLNEIQMLKGLLRLLSQSKNVVDNSKRYLYQNGLHHSPSVDKMRPGEMRIDLQMDEGVMDKCPNCRLYLNYKCISDDCHNKNELLFPKDGYSWADFKHLFVSPATQGGVWVNGLEDGMKYEVWDSVMLDGQVYPGYTNPERRVIVIPK